MVSKDLDSLSKLQEALKKICKDKGGRVVQESNNKIICRLRDGTEVILWDRELIITQPVEVMRKHIRKIKELEAIILPL